MRAGLNSRKFGVRLDFLLSSSVRFKRLEYVGERKPAWTSLEDLFRLTEVFCGEFQAVNSSLPPLNLIYILEPCDSFGITPAVIV